MALGSTMLPPIAMGENQKLLIDQDYYPPSLTGMRGSHDGAYEVAHQMGRFGRKDWGKVKEAEDPIYDLVVVGAGISGLAAARFYQQKLGKGARILLLDNHDDFGGHAKRNEFNAGNEPRMGYGGSQSMEDPEDYSDNVKGLLDDLGVDLESFEEAYDFDFFEEHGLRSMTFFDQKIFGKNQLVPYTLNEYAFFDIPGLIRDRIPNNEALRQMPLKPEVKKQLDRLINATPDSLNNISFLDRIGYASETPYFEFLKEQLGIDEPLIYDWLRMIPAGDNGSGADTITLAEALGAGMPGINSRAFVPLIGEWIKEKLVNYKDDYYHHFPDGNASIARLLVRKLIPKVAPGNSMEDIVLAPFDYRQLDQPDSNVRLRLNSTVVNVKHEGSPDQSKQVSMVYVRNNQAYRVRAKNCVMACYNRIIPHIVPELPSKQKEALQQLVKAPLVYTNVLLKNWKSLKNLGLGAAQCPGQLHFSVAMDYPVSMGGYQSPQSPEQPVALHMEYVPVSATMGLPVVDQYKEGRHKLMVTPFSTFEKEIKAHLGTMLGPGGFDPERDISAITVNRWSHGYAFAGDSLHDEDLDEEDQPHVIGRQRFGRITIANSDAGANAYMNEAIDQAWRAIHEIGTH